MDDVAHGQDDLRELVDAVAGLSDAPDLSAAPYGYRDWRNSDQLPRRKLPGFPQGFYNRRQDPISLLVVHHSASNTDDIVADNRYHTEQRNWDETGKTVLHAPHIAYHYYIARNGLLTACNYLWERAWHATDANDKGVGIVCPGDFDSGTSTATAAQRATLQWLIGELMGYFTLDRTAVWGHGELRQYGNSSSCPGHNFLPAVQAFRKGVNFVPGPPPPPAQIRWQVVDPNGAEVGVYSLAVSAASAAELVGGVGIYVAEGAIRIDFRNATHANPGAPAKWRVCDPAGTHVGLYNQTPNAVDHAESIRGYALYLYDTVDGNIRMDFRDLPAA